MNGSPNHQRRLAAVTDAPTVFAKSTVAGFVLALCVFAVAACDAFPPNTVESHYLQSGPEAVSNTVIKNGEDNDLYKIYYPSSLAGPYPLVVWGNGSTALPEDYDGVMTHIASWGFVVIDTFDEDTGSGAEIRDAALYAIAENTAPGGLFEGKILAAKIAGVGHSQGGAGVINAHTNHPDDPLFSALVTVALPALPIAAEAGYPYEAGKISSPVFLTGGLNDIYISPLGSVKSTFAAIPDPVPAAFALLKGANHYEFELSGGRTKGYVTAWLRFRLYDDPLAAQAFTGEKPEIMNNAAWTEFDIKNM